MCVGARCESRIPGFHSSLSSSLPVRDMMLNQLFIVMHGLLQSTQDLARRVLRVVQKRGQRCGRRAHCLRAHHQHTRDREPPFRSGGPSDKAVSVTRGRRLQESVDVAESKWTSNVRVHRIELYDDRSSRHFDVRPDHASRGSHTNRHQTACRRRQSGADSRVAVAGGGGTGDTDRRPSLTPGRVRSQSWRYGAA